MTQVFLTVGEIARRVHAPVWKVRRIVDSLGRDIPRAGQYRLVSADMLPAIVERVREQATATGAAR